MGGAMFVLPSSNGDLHAHVVPRRPSPAPVRIKIHAMCNKYYLAIEAVY
jgi:hypothetical protein